MLSSLICLRARVWEDCITHKYEQCVSSIDHMKQSSIKSSVDHIAIHYAYATCFTKGKKKLRTLVWVKFSYSQIIKPNSFICTDEIRSPEAGDVSQRKNCESCGLDYLNFYFLAPRFMRWHTELMLIKYQAYISELLGEFQVLGTERCLCHFELDICKVRLGLQ